MKYIALPLCLVILAALPASAEAESCFSRENAQDQCLPGGIQGTEAVTRICYGGRPDLYWRVSRLAAFTCPMGL